MLPMLDDKEGPSASARTSSSMRMVCKNDDELVLSNVCSSLRVCFFFQLLLLP